MQYISSNKVARYFVELDLVNYCVTQFIPKLNMYSTLNGLRILNLPRSLKTREIIQHLLQ